MSISERIKKADTIIDENPAADLSLTDLHKIKERVNDNDSFIDALIEMYKLGVLAGSKIK